MRERELVDLDKMCDDDDQRQLVFSLLERFNFLRADVFGVSLESVVNKIVNDWECSENETVIAPLTYDDAPDSGQMIIQQIKSKFSSSGWGHIKLLNRCPSLWTKKYAGKYHNVILIDEFSGTGSTVLNQISALRKGLEGLGIDTEVQIYICLIAGMEEAIQCIEATGCTVFCCHEYKAGISGFRTGDELLKDAILMNELEAKLLQNVNGETLPSFGYGQAEALYALENGNIPNSVFPLFWWNYLSDGTAFYSLFDRMDPKYA